MRDRSQEGLKIIDVKGKSSNIDKSNVLSAKLSREGITLDCSTICNSLIRVDATNSRVLKWCWCTSFCHYHSPCCIWAFRKGTKGLQARCKVKGVGARVHHFFCLKAMCDAQGLEGAHGSV